MDLTRSVELEKEINSIQSKLRRKYHDNIAQGDENIRGSMVYNDVVSQCEKVGDHIMNINEAIAGAI